MSYLDSKTISNIVTLATRLKGATDKKNDGCMHIDCKFFSCELKIEGL